MKIGRNDPCHCGSGKKYKFCHYELDLQAQREAEAAARAEAEAKAAAAESEDQQQTGETASTDDSSGEAPSADKHHADFGHGRDRSRFHGDSRGGSSNFKPRVNRGSQRGS